MFISNQGENLCSECRCTLSSPLLFFYIFIILIISPPQCLRSVKKLYIVAERIAISRCGTRLLELHNRHCLPLHHSAELVTVVGNRLFLAPRSTNRALYYWPHLAFENCNQETVWHANTCVVWRNLDFLTWFLLVKSG